MRARGAGWLRVVEWEHDVEWTLGALENLVQIDTSEQARPVNVQWVLHLTPTSDGSKMKKAGL